MIEEKKRKNSEKHKNSENSKTQRSTCSRYLIRAIAMLVMLIVMSGCSDTEENKDIGANTETKVDADTLYDIDLTTLSSTMVYAKVYDMVTNPAMYIGKSVKADGVFFKETVPETGNEYYYVVIADAAACCQQGLEIKRNEACSDRYPEVDGAITVIGIFDSYTEDDKTYYYIDTKSIH